MTMHNPPHPGEFIYDVYLKTSGFSCRYLRPLHESHFTFIRR